MARPIDHSADLLGPGRRRGAPPRAVPWARIFVALAYVTATACAIAFLALAWRHELDRRQASDSSAAVSAKALRTAQEKIGALEEENQTLSARAERLTARLETTGRQSSRREAALRNTRTVVREAETFVAALDGLDEAATVVVSEQGHVVRAVGTLAAHLDSLSRYLSKTKEQALDRTVLIAQLRRAGRDLASIRAILTGMAAEKKALAAAVDPLAKATELDAALRSALIRTKRALAR